MAEIRKKLPIGIEFFRDFKAEQFYYVDKTEFIHDLLQNRGSVNLFTRPRRFGKSLNMDMLKSFFEVGADASLFDGLKIMEFPALCEQYMGKYPVVSVEERYGDIKDWYDGYRFGSVEVYCPWDVINQCDKLRACKDAPMESHWENSSSNTIIQDILQDATETTKAEIEALISGEYVEKQLIPELTYTDLENKDPAVRQTYLWSVLFASGYLTDAGRPRGRSHRLVIPNREVRGIFIKFRRWAQ